MEHLENLFDKTAMRVMEERTNAEMLYKRVLDLKDKWCIEMAEKLAFLKGRGFNVTVVLKDRKSPYNSDSQIVVSKRGRDVSIRPYVDGPDGELMEEFRADSLYSPFSPYKSVKIDEFVKMLATWC